MTLWFSCGTQKDCHHPSLPAPLHKIKVPRGKTFCLSVSLLGVPFWVPGAVCLGTTAEKPRAPVAGRVFLLKQHLFCHVLEWAERGQAPGSKCRTSFGHIYSHQTAYMTPADLDALCRRENIYVTSRASSPQLINALDKHTRTFLVQ